VSVGDSFIPVVSYWQASKNYSNHVADPQGDIDASNQQESFFEGGRREYAVVEQED